MLTKVSKPLMSKKEAEKFVNDLMDTLFVKGKIDYIENFYTKDFFFYYRDESFNLQDIYKRVSAIKANTTNFHFIIEDLFVIYDLIIFRVKQTWKTVGNKGVNETVVFGVYRIHNKKVAEAWFSMDLNTKSYADINRNFIENMRLFEINCRDKQFFLKRLAIIAEFNKNFKFSKTEQECLYYYFHGFSAKETAQKIGLSFRTIQTYISQIKDRLGCKTKLSLRKKLFSEF